MVDALVSGTSVSDDVKVRVLSWAPRGAAMKIAAPFSFVRHVNRSNSFCCLAMRCHGPLGRARQTVSRSIGGARRFLSEDRGGI